MPVPCFDRYIVVAWSASSRPKSGRESIWLTTVSRQGVTREPINPPTRAAAAAVMAEWLIDECGAGRRVLIGCDFAYGYSAGFAGRAGLTGPEPWRAVWAHLQ